MAVTIDQSLSPLAQTDTQQPADDAQGQIERLLAQNTALAVELSTLRKRMDAANLDTSVGPGPAASDSPGSDDADSSDILQLRTALEARTQEIVALTRLLEEHHDHGPDGRHSDMLRAYAAGLEDTHLRMLSSTSWRLTAPLRAMIRILRRQPRPAPFKARFLDYQ